MTLPATTTAIPAAYHTYRTVPNNTADTDPTTLLYTDTAFPPISTVAPEQFSEMDVDFRERMFEFYNETRKFERRVGIIIPSIFTIVIIVGLVGNLLVIIVALNRQMRNSTNTLILGLTCSDLMFLTLCVPFTAIDYAFPNWVLPTWTCNAINYLQVCPEFGLGSYGRLAMHPANR